MSSILLHAIHSDHGPIYTETDFSQWVVEPFNTLSALLFPLVVIYWVYKLRTRYSKQLFLSSVLPVLAIGGIGGTIYHAFRSHYFWMYMDWLPILIISLSAAAYFVWKIDGRRWVAVAYLLGAVVVQVVLFFAIPDTKAYKDNLTYAILGLSILIPCFQIMRLTKYKGVRFFAYAFALFALALFFRIADTWQWISIGTHFLWHVFGALACHLMMYYIFKLKKSKLLDHAPIRA